MDDAGVHAQAAAGRCVAALWNRQQEPGAASTTPEAAARAEFLGASPPLGALGAWHKELSVAQAQGRLRLTQDDQGGQLLRALQAVGTASQARAAEAAERGARDTSGSCGARPQGVYPASGSWQEVVGPSPGEADWWANLAGELDLAIAFLKRYEIREPASWRPTPEDHKSWQVAPFTRPAADCWQKVIGRNALQARAFPE